jgi:hypothetical protein
MEAVLATSRPATVPARRRPWAAAIVTALPALFLAFDGVSKLLEARPVLEATQRLGYPLDTARPLGLVLLACLALYLVPRTAVLGAVLLTGYLGGAVATHVRMSDPLATHVLFPVYVATLLWTGLYLRDGRLQALVPWRGARS